MNSTVRRLSSDQTNRKAFGKACAAITAEGLLIWAFPVLAIFGAAAVIAGAAIGLVLIATRGGMDEFAIVFRHDNIIDRVDSEVVAVSGLEDEGFKFTDQEHFAAVFELHYGSRASYHDKRGASILWQACRDEVISGRMDWFGLYCHVRSSGAFTPEQRAELLKDITELDGGRFRLRSEM